MIDFSEALALVLREAQLVGPVAAQRCGITEVVGRVLAEDVLSPVNLPGADYSAMDGYAVLDGDLSSLEGAASRPQTGSIRLRVASEARAGQAGPRVEPGTCARIFTGAHIPAGATAVVMQENVQRDGEFAIFEQPVKEGANIRRMGEDLKKGSLVLQAGTRLSAFSLGLLASAERTEVCVRRPPEVTVVCTGDELRPPGTLLLEEGSAGLAESNGYSLAAHVTAAGGSARRAPLVRDQMDELKQALLSAKTGSDVIVTVGGVSVGDYDIVRPALEELGAELVFHKVSIKPGKPVLFMRWGETLVLGLPGNPSSAQVTFALFGYPLIRALSGDLRPVASARSARLSHDFQHKAGRRSFYRGMLEGGAVTLLDNQASGASTVMSWANTLVVIDEACESLQAGAEVPVIAYADL